MNINIKERIDEKYNAIISVSFPKKNLLIEVTNKCNNKCIFCANRKMTRKTRFIDFDLAKRVLKECYDLGSREVGFYATGEPLLYPNLDNLISEANLIGYDYIYLTTNGLLADEKLVESLIKSGLQSIKFSINAIDREDYKFIHGLDAFDIVMNNLKKCKELQKKYNFKLFVSTILTRYTNYELNKVEDYFQKYCDKVVVQNVKNQGGLLPMINDRLLISSNEKNSSFSVPCSYMFNAVCITCEGYITGCCMDFQNYLAYADINNKSIKDAWECEIIKDCRKAQLNGDVGNTICKCCIGKGFKNIKPLCEDLATEVGIEYFEKDEEMDKRIKLKKGK